MTELTPASMPPKDTEATEAPDVVVAGYASLDYVWRAERSPVPGRTALLLGDVDPPPRFGGCGPNVARHLARLGRRATLITWLGDDQLGQRYLRYLVESGVDVRWVVLAPGQRSPRSILIYDREGVATCLYHPSGSAGAWPIDPAPIVSRAAALALTVAPAPVTDALLEGAGRATVVAWSVKADPQAYPAELITKILRRADLVVLNRDEVAFVAEALPPSHDDPLEAIGAATSGRLVVTAGADGCSVRTSSGWTTIPAEPVEVMDPTGVGDAFFAAFLHAHLAGVDPLVGAAAANRYAVSFLRPPESVSRSEGVAP